MTDCAAYGTRQSLPATVNNEQGYVDIICKQLHH